MSIYNENSTLFMSKAERDSAIYEAETNIIPGYTSTIDFFKVIEGAYRNDMAVFEALYNSDVEELRYKRVLLSEASSDEKESAKTGIRAEIAKKVEQLKQIVIKAIDKLTQLWASLLDSIDKGFEKVRKQILVGGEKKFEKAKEDFIAKDFADFKPQGTFYKSVNYADIQNRIEIINSALSLINMDTIEAMISKLDSDDKIEEVVLDTFVKNLGTGNDIDKDVKTFEKYKESLSLKEDKDYMFNKDEVLNNITNLLNKDDNVHQLKNTVYTKLRNLKRDVATSYRGKDNETIEKLNKANKIISSIRVHFSYRFNELFNAKKKALSQAYALFRQGLRYTSAKSADAVAEATIEEIEIINMIDEI